MRSFRSRTGLPWGRVPAVLVVACAVALLAPVPASADKDWRALVEAAAYAYEARRPHQAQELLEEAVGLTEPETEPRAAVLNNLAVVLETNGYLHAAEQLYGQVIGLWARLLGPTHVNVARTLGNLADLHHRLGQLAEAAEAYELALETARHATGPDVAEVRAALEAGYALVQAAREPDSGSKQ